MSVSSVETEILGKVHWTWTQALKNTQCMGGNIVLKRTVWEESKYVIENIDKC